MSLRRRLESLPAGIPVAAGALGLALVATFPLLATPFARLIGHPDVDVTNHAWGPWWWWITIGRGELPWQTTLLAAPEGGVLWFIDPFLAAVGAALVGIVGVVGAYNLVVVLYVALAAVSGRALARAFGAGAAASWVAAAAVAVSPYLLCEVHNGVTEAVGVCWSTFALAATRRAIAADAPDRVRRWIVAGLWLGAAGAGTWYYGLATGVTMGAWALAATLGPGGWRPGAWREVARIRRDARMYGGGVALAGLVGVVVAAPVLWLVRNSISDPRSLVVRGDVDAGVREFLLAHNAVDVRAFVAPFGFQSVDLAAGGEAFLHSSYVGLVALGLAAVAVRARPALGNALAGVLPVAVLSLGAYLWWGDGWVTVGSTRFALPFGWLVAALPDAGSTHAQRLVWPVVATVAALAAVGAEHVARGRRSWLVGLGAVVFVDLLVSAPWPLARVDALDLRAHARLDVLARAESAAARNPETRVSLARGVLDLPAEVGATMATSRYLVYQTASELPIPYRPDARGGTARAYGMPWFNLLFLPSAGQDAQAAALKAELGSTTRLDLASFDRGGIRWVVLHRELERGRGDVIALEAQLRAWFGEPDPLGPHLTWDVAKRRSDGGDVLIGR
ncbi:MAG: hypothetical protein Q8P41_19075 [Pseudomonadota bacterium]|nr:hypothetical protein [Pseudomonadota bacterium]